MVHPVCTSWSQQVLVVTWNQNKLHSCISRSDILVYTAEVKTKWNGVCRHNVIFGTSVVAGLHRTSFIRPHLDYTSIVWNPHLKGEVESLENVQKFALWVCLKSWDSEYNELLRVANLPPLHKRRAQLSLCHLYKIIHNQCYFPPIFSTRETRMHVNRSFLLTQPFTWSNSYFYSFVPNVISLWNSLPESLFLNSLSIVSFCNVIS